MYNLLLWEKGTRVGLVFIGAFIYIFWIMGWCLFTMND